ncbi:hypothetical protein [Asinibacterium sp. OR53]|uniref:8-oxoguanine DNA glycosylase OGG fold protein n=1 Tax=Asinibacterium sp. OR53 TaxID=925409 RepID=UPI00047937FD|nr:hypothetical protein [Asinibacterium sp. OR53]
MELAAYTNLIKQIPYREHSFETKRKVWEPYRNRQQFIQFYNDTLLNNEVVTFSRGELFSIVKEDPCKAIFATILWGYPNGYTLGFNMATLFPKFLKQVKFLSKQLPIQKSITEDELKNMLKSCNGIGLSTLTKLLYFFNIKMDGNRCLIMDARIIRILNNTEFKELRSFFGMGTNEQSGIRHYADYLRVCSQLSKKYGYKPDQLELFLFLFGNNLKNQ